MRNQKITEIEIKKLKELASQFSTIDYTYTDNEIFIVSLSPYEMIQEPFLNSLKELFLSPTWRITILNKDYNKELLNKCFPNNSIIVNVW